MIQSIRVTVAGRAATGSKTGESRYGEGETLSAPAPREGGTRISVEFTILAMRGAGRIAGIAAVMRDVTARFEEPKRPRQAA